MNKKFWIYLRILDNLFKILLYFQINNDKLIVYEIKYFVNDELLS